MDFDKPKVYDDTSITDGLVSIDKIISSSLTQIATGILGHCVEVRFDEQRCLGTTHYSGRTISTFSHISSFASSQTCNFA